MGCSWPHVVQVRTAAPAFSSMRSVKVAFPQWQRASANCVGTYSLRCPTRVSSSRMSGCASPYQYLPRLRNAMDVIDLVGRLSDPPSHIPRLVEVRPDEHLRGGHVEHAPAGERDQDLPRQAALRE